MLCGQKVKSLRAHDRGNMPRRDEAVNVGVAAIDECLEWRFDGNVVAEHREVGHVAYAGSLQRRCGGGRGGFKADAKEDDFLGGVFFGELEGIKGRVDEADVGTRARACMRDSVEPGTRIMSPKQVRMTLGC